MKRHNCRWTLPLSVLTLGATAIASASDVFLDVTATHVPSADQLHALDAVFVDVDKDGDLDAVLAVEGDVNRLYINDGTGRLSWRQGVFGTVAHDTEHVLSADFNRDGNADVMFIAEDDQVHQLFFGDGKGGFTDVSDRLPARSEGNGFAIGDVNGDGLVDIVLGNTGKGARNFLWLSDPNRPGYFIDASKTNLPDVENATQGIALADLDGDGDLDMVLANEVPPNRLLLNDGRGRFTDASDRMVLSVPLHTREVHVFDATGDGKPDILFLNLTSNARQYERDPQARLLVNDGRGRFVDESAQRLPANTFSSWGGAVVDFNDDGHPDLIVGAIAVPGFKPLQARAYTNDGKGNFKDVTAQVLPATVVGRSWSMAVGDLNGDGKDDVFIGGWGTQARLLLRK
ncbi:FG-GAP repeat domain-containing protein [Steroidobacter cummioxidans]|uniref:FG-GAP repeat domain-containing protein n=1 Tax=Steroidobacter cummioxidans TaxID=1803913 RepID=UPI000E311E86|nr:VCBS repeat-containing protein [Steroidobacter cummioxidans]